jgi:AcrR family transcriptional regulator
MISEAIIDAAEQVFGEVGIDGASLRQISRLAGSGTHYAVQYHFGSKEALIKAIFARRLPDLERRRGDMLSEAGRAGLLQDPQTLMDVLLRPLIFQTDTNGHHSYAAFLINVYWHSSVPITWLQDVPLTKHIMELLYGTMPDIPADITRERVRLATVMFLHVLVNLDRSRAEGRENPFADRLIDDAIAMAAGAITTPLPASFGDVAAPSARGRRAARAPRQVETVGRISRDN